MAAGKRYKFQGSKFMISMGFDTASPALAPTAITNAKPAVMALANHGMDDGDVVRLSGIVGMDELNDGVYVVEVVDDDHVELVGVDSTDYGAYASGGVVETAAYSNFCELTSWNRSGGTSPEIEATAACSTAAEFEVGLPDFGTTAIDYHFAPQTPVQIAVEAAHKSGEIVAFRVELPRRGGIMVLLGFITQTSEQAAVGGLWTGSLSVRNTGERLDFQAPV